MLFMSPCRTSLLLLIGLCVLTGRAGAQTSAGLLLPATGRQLADFVPPGYELLPRGQAFGDLNRDGRPDAALVLRSLAENDTVAAAAEETDVESQPRHLIIVLGTPGGYTLAAQTDKAALCNDCGGMYGDPFEGIEIKKGVLSLSHYGGSSWRWGITTKYRYQTGRFYLIGERRVSYRNNGPCGESEWELHETNFVTGDYREEKDSPNCRPLLRKRGHHQPTSLRRLVDYAVEP